VGEYNFNPRFMDVTNYFNTYELVWVITLIVMLVSLFIVMSKKKREIRLIAFIPVCIYFLAVATLLSGRFYMQTFYYCGHYGYFQYERMFTEVFKARHHPRTEVITALITYSLFFYSTALYILSYIYQKFLK